MARNQIPTNYGQLLGLAVKMHQGLEICGETLGISQLPPEGFQDSIDAYVAAEGAFGTARSGRLAVSGTAQAKQAALHDWLAVVRNVLAARFGNRWSTEWAQAGFTNNSTAVPPRQQERMAVARQLAALFTANPAYQVAPLNVTAAFATTLYGEVLTAQNAVMAAEVILTERRRCGRRPIRHSSERCAG